MLQHINQLKRISSLRVHAAALTLVLGLGGSLAVQPVWAQAKPQESKADSRVNTASQFAKSDSKPQEITETNNGFFSNVVSTTTNVASNVANKTGDIVLNALNLIGVRYRYGGNSPDSGLDCSGFVRYVFNDTFGFLLPRQAAAMSQSGTRVAQAELKPGDLVFFNTMRRTFSHVGIYVGDNKFVHAPRTGATIRVDDIRNSYWSTRFDGARRIETAERGGDVQARLNSAMEALQKNDGKY